MARVISWCGGLVLEVVGQGHGIRSPYEPTAMLAATAMRVCSRGRRQADCRRMRQLINGLARAGRPGMTGPWGVPRRVLPSLVFVLAPGQRRWLSSFPAPHLSGTLCQRGEHGCDPAGPDG